MTITKLPPIEKIPEAFSVLADQRITMYDDHADIVSSNQEKQYTVLFHENLYQSNDAATYWQGYPGYPIIAVWLIQKRLCVDETILPYFKAIPWHQLNEQYHRKYDQVLEALYQKWEKEGIDVAHIRQEIQTIYETMKTLDVEVKKNTKKPIKHSSLNNI